MHINQTNQSFSHILQLGIESKKQLQSSIEAISNPHYSDNDSCLQSNASEYQISHTSHPQQTTLIDYVKNNKQTKCDASRNSSIQKESNKLNAQQLIKNDQSEKAINMLTQRVLKCLRIQYNQIEELMKVVEANILDGQQKKIRKKLSMGYICSRNWKSKKSWQHSLTKRTDSLRNHKNLQRKQQSLSQKIIEQRQKFQKLNTKAVLLQNYINVTIKGAHIHKISPNSQYSLTKTRNQKINHIFNNSSRKKVMIKRRDVLKQAIQSSRHNIQNKIKILADEKFLLKQELQIVKIDILRLQKQNKKYNIHRVHSLNKIQSPYLRVFRGKQSIDRKRTDYLQRSSSNGSSQKEIRKVRDEKSKNTRWQIEQQYFSGARNYRL